MIIAVVIFVVLIPAICSACFHYYFYKHGFDDDELEWSDCEDEDYSDSDWDDDYDDGEMDNSVSSNGTKGKKQKRRFKFCSCLKPRRCKLAPNKSSVVGKDLKSVL